ncbi:hypothetical protein LshimejAT787_0802800 [Lyophyllum shimeji]|uniref:Uncharacterized protein n=1 Tax=Lyophyllum shimeji TaxID=47721 RepID=A0A9P3PRW9_LYOSH|nr:hypothetical protein LshimejAT787_0802800 [Lyophyllum shimeji]
MASKPAPPPLAERQDIHKSCKSLETLLNVLNDYCEAAGTLVLLQKKLAKALRDTASMKTTGEIAANAMNASATIFEVSSDIDSKFAKIADKEYDAISAEVKKWFKKLAKEEKTHDERMANANTRIKQAGQVYEKKAKKNARDTTEEHTRYINLISALGPEISQEKYNHAFSVTQRHCATTYSTAACLSRIADAEWLKTCEGVRRFAPTIGQLGEWRALCEGAWTGPVPTDLPDMDESQQPHPDREITTEKQSDDGHLQAPASLPSYEARDHRGLPEQARFPAGLSSGAEAEPFREPTTTRHSPTLSRADHQNVLPSPQRLTSTAPSAYEAPRPFADKNNTDSVRSLSAFPLPPTHFPIPPPRQQQSSQSQSSQSSYANMPQLSESPLPEIVEHGDGPPPANASPKDVSSSTTLPPSPEQRFQEKPNIPDISSAHPPDIVEGGNKLRQPIPVRSQTMPPAVATYSRDAESAATTDGASRQAQDEDSFDTDREFGVNVGYIPKSQTAELSKSYPVERTDTAGNSGSIVAAMRNRYSNNSGSTSPTPKDVPRLPLSVTDLASRYQPPDGPSSPRLRTPSVTARQLPLTPADTGTQMRQANFSQDRSISCGNLPARSSPPSSPRQEEAGRRREQRLRDLAQLEKEIQLLERERDIERRAQEMERERARLAGEGRQTDGYGNPSDTPRAGDVTPQAYDQLRPRERKPSFRTQRPQSQLEPARAPAPSSPQNPVRPHSQYSYSTSHLVPPSPSSTSGQPSHSHDGGSSQSQSHHSQYSQSPTSSHQSPQTQTAAHAPYCGCESCSVAKYRESRSPPEPRPPAEPIALRPEKSKPGWIRRLSMDVGNAFSLDSKKGIGHIAGGGAGSRSGVFSMDGKKNVSSTVFRVQEDGRSYEASGVSNRSMTNLGMGRR